MNITESKFYRDKCFINGEWVGADSGETISVNNPATLKEIGTVPKCGTNETKRAIEGMPFAYHRGVRRRDSMLMAVLNIEPTLSGSHPTNEERPWNG